MKLVLVASMAALLGLGVSNNAQAGGYGGVGGSIFWSEDNYAFGLSFGQPYAVHYYPQPYYAPRYYAPPRYAYYPRPYARPYYRGKSRAYDRGYYRGYKKGHHKGHHKGRGRGHGHDRYRRDDYRGRH